MLLFAAIKASISAIISNALASYLEVSVTDIESRLLKRDAHLLLSNVKIRDQTIPIAIQSENVVCFLIVTGTLQELALDWTWSSTLSSKNIIDNVTLAIPPVTRS